ncbi:MAG TPA: hypothetical protein VN026_15395 [Bacteroidia bacterium]|jgi:hypothetical protein|nr:hypothetical protein [Bacteroidia bacterium]
MKKAIVVLFTISLLTECTNENKTEVVNNPASGTVMDSSVNNKNEGRPKSDAEVILDAANIAVNATKDIIRQNQIKDSINLAHKEKYFAFKIGLKQHKKDAIEMYKKLIGAGISSIYIFHISKKENYLVKFEAKGEEDLKLAMSDFKTQLGEFGNDGLDIINLTDPNYCSKNQTISKHSENDSGIDINYLVCE